MPKRPPPFEPARHFRAEEIRSYHPPIPLLDGFDRPVFETDWSVSGGEDYQLMRRHSHTVSTTVRTVEVNGVRRLFGVQGGPIVATGSTRQL